METNEDRDPELAELLEKTLSLQAKNDQLRAQVRDLRGDLTAAVVKEREAQADELTKEILEVEADVLALATEDQRSDYLRRGQLVEPDRVRHARSDRRPSLRRGPLCVPR